LPEAPAAQYLSVLAMTARTQRPAWLPTAPRGALASCLLSLVLLASAARAERSYVYCLSMQEVMARPCCPSGATARLAAMAATLAAPASDCCELRSLPGMTAYAGAGAQGTALAALHVATIAPPALVDGARGEPILRYVAAMRTGPPPARARARLMVFHI
jgi:hypothetical protein